MNKSLLCLALLALNLVSAFAQSASDVERAETILIKTRKLELLNQLLPVLMTKEQIKALLPAIEKARANVRTIHKMEADDLKKLEAKLDESIKNGLEKGAVPPREQIQDIAKLMRAFQIRRQVAANENLETVLPVFMKELNAGQQKAAANSLDPRFFDPNAKPEEMKVEDKVRVFVREIVLDPLSYDLLVKLSR
jgi:hypothetical protein